MKPQLKRNLKRCLALVLALILLASSSIYQHGSGLWATSEDGTNSEDIADGAVVTQEEISLENPTSAEEPGNPDGAADTDDAGETDNAGEVDGADAETNAADTANADAAKDAQNSENADGAETNAEDAGNADDAAKSTDGADAAKNAEDAGNADEAEVPEKSVYTVEILKPEMDGGKIQVEQDGRMVDVKYDANGKYSIDFTEGTKVNIKVSLENGYTLEKVIDQNEKAFTEKSVENNVYSYELDVKENMQVAVIYKKVETAKEPETQKTSEQNDRKDAAEDDDADAAETEPEKDSEQDASKPDEPKTDAAVTEDEEYALTIVHHLTTGIGEYEDTETVTVKGSELKVGYDVLKHAYTREGLKVTDDSLVVTAANFDENREGNVIISYEIADGYKAVHKSAAGAMGRALRAAARVKYVGRMDSIDIGPANQLLLNISYTNEDGTIAFPDVNEMLDEKDGGGFDIDKTVDLKEGYTLRIDFSEGIEKGEITVSRGTIRANAGTNVKKVTIDVSVVANDATYTVNHHFAGLGEEAERVETESKSGKVGSLTEAEAKTDEPGFSSEAFDQKTVEGDNSTEVDIYYGRNEYKVIYDTQGGSYVKSKKGVYGQEVEVYQKENGSSVLTCGRDEHTHTYEDSRWRNGRQQYKGGCYSSSRWTTQPNCGKQEHTHNDNCYTVYSDTYNPTATKQGYDFGGWYQDAECNTPAEESVTLKDNNVTVYAKWVPKDVNYTVVYMKEAWDNETNQGYYVYDSSVTRTAKAGSTVTGSNNKSIAYHEFDHAESATVAGDGSTVVRVYYKLTVYTIKFTWTQSGWKLRWDGTDYNSAGYTISARLGQDVSGQWPTSENMKGTGNEKFYTWTMTNGRQSSKPFATKIFEITEEILECSDNEDVIKATGDWNANLRSYNVEYYLQDLNGNYVKSEKYSQTANSTKGFDAKEIYGYQYVREESGNSTYKFYYNRTKYSIEYRYKDAKLDTKSNIMFGADISGTEYNYTPKRPDGVDADSVFAGWYSNAECQGDPYVFDTMPGGNLVLYAKWEAREKVVTLKYNDGSEDKSEKVKKGSVANIEILSRPGYDFDGWYTEDGKAFDISEPIMEDVTIYAHWTRKTVAEYTIRYIDKATGKDIIEPVKRIGRDGQTVTVKAMAFKNDARYSTYAPDKLEATVTLNIDSPQEIVFEYVAPSELRYTVQYIYNGDTKAEQKDLTAETASFKIYPDSKIAKKLKAEGYEIDGKFVSAQLVADNSKNVYTFNLKPDVYTISYEGLEEITGWDGKTEIENPNAVTYTVETDDIKLINPVKEGYEFDGWEMGKYTDVAEGSESHEGAKKEVTITKGSKGHLTFVAKWSPKKYKVNYNLNGATGTIESKEVEWLADNLLPNQEPTRDGYTFEGWKFGDKTVIIKDTYKEVVDGDSSKNEITLVAQWKRSFDEDEVSVTPYEGTYDGQSHGVKVTFEAKEGDVVQYSVNGKNGWTGNALEYADVTVDNDGKYPVYVRVVNGSVISSVYGSYVKIKPISLTVKPKDGSYIYNGQEQGPEDYDIDGQMVAGENLSGISVTGKKTNAGSGYKATAQKTDSFQITKADGSVVPTANYDITFEENTFTIAKKPLTITAGSVVEPFTYDGKEHGVKTDLSTGYLGYTVDGLVAGEELAGVSVDSMKTNAGQYDTTVDGTAKITKTVNGKPEDSTNNYIVETKAGSFTIAKAAFETSNLAALNTVDVSEVYDGQPHSAGQATVSNAEDSTLTAEEFAALAKGLKIEYRVKVAKGQEENDWTENWASITATNVNDGPITIEVRVTSDNFSDTLSGEQTLEITKRPVVIKVDDKSKNYGEKEPKFTGTVDKVKDDEESGLVDGDDLGTIEYSRTNSGVEDVGEYLGVLDAECENLNPNYEIKEVEKGTFTIKRTNENAINVENTVVTYDGESYGLASASATKKSSTLYFSKEKDADKSDTNKWSTTMPTFKDAGEYKIYVYAANPNYEDTEVVEGTITINKREVTITASSYPDSGNMSAIVYDGKEHAVASDGYSITSDMKLVNGEELTGLVVEGKGTNVGKYPTKVTEGSRISYDIKDEDGKSTKNNYVIHFVDGEFEITKASAEDKNIVSLKGNNVEQYYNGRALAAGTAAATSNLSKDDEFKIEYSLTENGTEADWKESPELISRINATEPGEPITVYVRASHPNYDGYATTTQTMTVKRAELVITANSGAPLQTEYDGAPRTVAGYEVKVENGVLPSTETITGIEAARTETNVGKYETEVKAKDGEEFKVTKAPTVPGQEGEDSTNNYTVRYEKGSFEIVRAKDINTFVTLTTSDKTETYNGQAQQANAATATSTRPNDNGTLIIEYQKDADDEDSWTRDITEITATNVSDSRVINVRVTSPNYEGAVTGTQKITITPITLTLKAGDETYNYDGTKKSVKSSNWDYAENSARPIEGETLAGIAVSGEGTNVDTYPTTINETGITVTKEVAGETVDTTRNYKIETEKGNLVINPVDIRESDLVTLTPTPVEKMYDGTIYTAGVAKVGVTAQNQNTEELGRLKVEYRVRGEGETEPGESGWTINPAEITATDVSESKIIDVRVTGDNFTGALPGTQVLTINPREVSIIVKAASKVYGQDDPEFTGTTVSELLESGQLISKDDLGEITFVRTNKGAEDAENVGPHSDVLDAVYTANSNYNVKVTKATFTITAASDNSVINVAGAGNTIMYDGKAHDELVQVKASKEDGSTLHYSTDEGNEKEWSTEKPSFTEAGTYTVYVYATNPNYTDTETIAVTVQITKRPLTITANGSEDITYDGQPHTISGYEITSGKLAEGEEITGVSASRTETDANTEANPTYTTAIADENALVIRKEGNAQTVTTENYDVKFETGSFKIKPASMDEVVEKGDVTLTGEDVVEAYKGSAYYAGEAVATSTLGNGRDQFTIEYSLDNENWIQNRQDIMATNVEDSIDVIYVRASNPNYDGYATAEEKITVTPKELTVTTGSGSKTYDGAALTEPGTITGWVSGEDAAFEVNGTQTLVGTSKNTYEIKWGQASAAGITIAKESNYTVKETVGDLTVTDGTGEDPIDPEKVVKKTHDDITYGIGDVITFNIEVTNIYDVAKDITITEQNGVRITGESKFENVEPGAKVTTTATYTVKEADILNGSFSNTVTAAFSDIEKTFTDEDVVEKIDEPDGKVEVEKKSVSTPANGEAYALGETISYEITVKNSGNVTMKDIVVEDELTNASWTVDELKPGETSNVLRTQYTVTEADVIRGQVINTATVTGGKIPDPENPDEEKPIDPEDPDDVVPGSETDETDPADAKLVVEKRVTSVPENGTSYALNETITYEITVTNEGNLTVRGFDVVDLLDGFEPAEGESWQNLTLAPKDAVLADDDTTPKGSMTLHGSYVVTEDDILAGSVANVATVSGGTTDDSDTPPIDPEDPDDVVPGEVETPTDDADYRLNVEKRVTNEPENGAVYGLGETIVYEVTVSNVGNLTAENVVVSDELTGDVWTVATLAPEASETFTASYVVTEEDILTKNGVVTNVAIAAADPIPNPNPENPEEPPIEPEVDPGEEDAPISTPQPSLFVEKTAAASENAYGVGDVIEYTIRVVNNGNVTMEGVEVTDDLTGDQIQAGDLEPNASQEITVTYIVTEADIIRGSITNVATAEGTDPNGEPIEARDEETVTAENGELEEAVAHSTITKTTTGTPANGRAYVLGEEITYSITVTNDGNLTLENVVVTDELTNDEWTVATLAPGASETFTARYEVTQADCEAGSVLNVATATADPIPNPDTPQNPEEPENPEEPIVPGTTPGENRQDVDPYYTLTIRYVNAAGDSVAPDYVGIMAAGTTFTVTSPEIDGFTPDYGSISSNEDGMPASDLTFTVTYTLIPGVIVVPTVPVAPAVPAAPAAPTAPVPVVPAAVIPVAPTPVPLAPIEAEVTPTENGYDLTEIEDEETPLANADLDHACCIFHFLVVLIALIVLAFYTKSRKKHQERIHELKEKLAQEESKEQTVGGK